MPSDVRRSELIAAISLAADLGMGAPLESGLGTCAVAVGLAGRLGLPPEEVSRVRLLALLQHIGCTATAHEAAAILGDEIQQRGRSLTLDFSDKREMGRFMLGHVTRVYPPLQRPGGLLRAAVGGQRLLDSGADVCESARMLGERFGYDPDHLHDLECVYENWDGTGLPAGLSGQQITRPARVTAVASAAVAAYHQGGAEAAVELVRRRSGHHLEPALADAFLAGADELIGLLETEDLWELAVDHDDPPCDDEAIDTCLRAIADFVDLKSPYLLGHSSGVAALAAGAAGACGLAPTEVTAVRRAAWVHDLGRVGVTSAIWAKPGRLSAHEQEQVRLHPYLTERVLARTPYLKGLADLAAGHHERVDGSGYHRGSTGGQQTRAARILAAADAFQSMVEDGPGAPGLTPEVAAKELRAEAAAGRLDPEAVDGVLVAAGQRVGRPARVAGLTPREVETLGHLAHGLSIRQIAREMTIAPKTVDGNIQRIYAKIGISTRAGATLFALANDLIVPGPRNGENSP
jgi:HD-GYP domain-containing protein (c-di-GMP phosphodiesterase class II)